MKFNEGDKVRLTAVLHKQRLLEELRLIDNLGTYGEIVGFRSRKESYGGQTGLIEREVTFDPRTSYTFKILADNHSWYSVYMKIGPASYQWLTFHESELELIEREVSNNGLIEWLTQK